METKTETKTASKYTINKILQIVESEIAKKNFFSIRAYY